MALGAGVHHAGMFATVNLAQDGTPFRPTEVPAPSFRLIGCAHSTTADYLSNLAQQGVFILHGSADNNVPVSEGRNMYAAVRNVSQDVIYHEELVRDTGGMEIILPEQTSTGRNV